MELYTEHFTLFPSLPKHPLNYHCPPPFPSLPHQSQLPPIIHLQTSRERELILITNGSPAIPVLALARATSRAPPTIHASRNPNPNLPVADPAFESTSPSERTRTRATIHSTLLQLGSNPIHHPTESDTTNPPPPTPQHPPRKLHQQHLPIQLIHQRKWGWLALTASPHFIPRIRLGRARRVSGPFSTGFPLLLRRGAIAWCRADRALGACGCVVCQGCV